MDLHVNKHGHTTACLVKSPPARYQVLKIKALLMRATILAIFLSVSGLLMAGEGNGQDLDKVFVTVNFKHKTLKSALQAIETITRLSFTYKTKDVSRYADISFEATDISVARLLKELLSSTDLKFEQVSSNIVIKRIRRQEDAAALDEVSQNIAGLFDVTVRGRIVDQKGQPVVNASVQLQGSSRGSIANANGEFSISEVKPGTYTLQVSAVGFTDELREIVVKDNEDLILNITLTARSTDLEEVVVTALGISRKQRSLGYATQEVKGENLTFTKEQNVIGSLAGKIAGVQVTGSSGASMGGTQKIKIRGVNSLLGTDQPLIVIDGTPISNANFAGRNGGDYGNLGQDVNPEDVETINVLKGPAASALYGIRGQYGVIMITTKKGARGTKKVNVQVNSAFSVERVGNLLPFQDEYGGGSSQTWRTLANGDKYVDMSIDESWGPRMDGTPVRQIFSFYPQDDEFGQLTPFNPHPDNIRDYFETGSTINNGISVSGGNENSTFRLSFNNTRIEGVEPNTWLRRNNLGVSASLDLTKKITVSTNFNYANNNGQRPAQGYEGGSRYLFQWFQRNIDMNRMKNYKYSDGTFLHWNLRRPAADGSMSNYSPLYWNNPYFEAYENYGNDNRDRVFGDVGLTYQMFPGLKLSGFVRADLFTQTLENREAAGGWKVPGYSLGKYQNREMNYEFLAQYTRSWGDFSLNANLGSNLYNRRYSYVSVATAGGLSSPDFYNIDASIDRPLASTYLLTKQIRSLYSMVSLGYKNTYFLDASIRNDNSSTLPENNNSYWYPSVSGSFVFSELLKWNPLTFGKLRLSYAKAGADLDPYLTSFTYRVGGVYGNNSTLFIPDELINPEIEPSFAHSYEAGIDLRFLKDRLGVSFTYYQQKNKNQIIRLDVSGTSGYNSARINAGLIQNQGVELTLTGAPVRSKQFSWEAIFNISRNRNKVVELYPGMNVYTHDQNRYSSVDIFLNSYVGGSFGDLIGKAYQRDEATGKILLGDNNLPLYTQANHNFGTVLPKFTGGLQNTFRILDKFDLSAMIDYQFGGQFFSWTQMMAVKTGLAEVTAATNDKGNNVRVPVADGGGVLVNGIRASTREEISAYVDARAYYRTTLGTHVYEEWLYDASYIKLREIRLGYTFGKSILGNLPISTINLALIARNPLMIWQEAPQGLDPSELSTGASSISWLETGGLNTVRSYGLNLIINF